MTSSGHFYAGMKLPIRLFPRCYQLPAGQEHKDQRVYRSREEPDAEGWLSDCAAAYLENEGALRFDHGSTTFALYHIFSGELFAVDWRPIPLKSEMSESGLIL